MRTTRSRCPKASAPDGPPPVPEAAAPLPPTIDVAGRDAAGPAVDLPTQRRPEIRAMAAVFGLTE
jgi:hypothetical protein